MSKKNIFKGYDKFSKFVNIIYKRFISGEWVTYKDVLLDFLSPKEKELLEEGMIAQSKCTGYGELKKAFPEVIEEIRKAVGNNECIEEQGNNKNKQFRYVGQDKDPLVELYSAVAIDDLKKYWEFCQDSAGFFPTAWLDYFFNSTKDLWEINQKKKQGDELLTSSIDRNVVNIEMLPSLYEAIKNKWVLAINYKPFAEDTMQLIFHPQHIREYNGRWHLFGLAEGKKPQWCFDIAVDRIQGEPVKKPNIKYQSAPKKYYKNFFKDKVGVSQMGTGDAVDVRIRAHNKNIFNLINTKPLHNSRKVAIQYGEHEDGEYGDFFFHVEINNEFIGSVLQMGAGLEVIEPLEVRQLFEQRIKNMYQRYNTSNDEKQ